MAAWALLAPGPSATREQAELARSAGLSVGVVGNAFQLAPWAEFIAATDMMWWRKYPEAKDLTGRKFSMHQVSGVERRRVTPHGPVCNSGLLAIDCARHLGASRILLMGYDMHGTHFFGKYENGLSNTTLEKRRMHLKQYANWAKSHPGIEVINCTEGSALTCFPMARLEDAIGRHV